jgi:hypothetical protein
MQSSCNTTSLVTIEQKIKMFKEKHTLQWGHMGILAPIVMFHCSSLFVKFLVVLPS